MRGQLSTALQDLIKIKSVGVDINSPEASASEPRPGPLTPAASSSRLPPRCPWAADPGHQGQAGCDPTAHTVTTSTVPTWASP